MVTIPKLLVVDKSVFHTFYDCDEKLCQFVKKYNIVLPYTLAIECVISENESGKEPDKLCIGLDSAIKAGANIGYQSVELLKEEKTTLEPIDTIVNETYTKQLRNSILEINMDLIKKLATSYMFVTKRKIDELLERAERLYKILCENQKFIEDFQKPTKIERRFKKWLLYMDYNNFLDNIVKKYFTEQSSSHVNSNWYTWQYLRLCYAYLLDLCHKKSLIGSCKKNDISNDFYDIEPVLYLLRADGLLTNDTKLEIPLAKAAFPNKDVFEVNTTVNASRTVQHIFDDIVNIIPQSYII